MEIFQEPYRIKDGILTIPDKPGYGVELMDDIEERFPFVPGPYNKTNPHFEGLGLPIWWSYRERVACGKLPFPRVSQRPKSLPTTMG